MNNSNLNTSSKQQEKGIADSAAEMAKDAKNMVMDIVDVTKETIAEKAHESQMQRPEDKGIAGLAAEFAHGIGDMVNVAVEGTKEMVSDAVEGTKEYIAAHNSKNSSVNTASNIQTKPLLNSDATLVKEIQEQHGDDVEITITKVTVKGLAGENTSNQGEDSAANLVQDARSMLNNAVESGNRPLSGSTTNTSAPAPSVTDSAKEFAKNVRDVISDAFQNAKEIAAEKGLLDSANKLANDVKATVGSAVETTKEKVSQAADRIADHLTDHPTHDATIPVKTEITKQVEKKNA